MLYFQYPQKVKLFCGLIYSLPIYYQKSRKLLEKSLGKIEEESNEFNFNFTNYYEKEMGKNLKRKFVVFAKLIDPAEAIKIKRICVSIEKKLSQNNLRRVNIDPGYINLAKIVLLTTKDFSHRIYLGKGVFAEVTCFFQQNNLKYLPWTYPDYQSEEYKEFFLKIRQKYKKYLKNGQKR